MGASKFSFFIIDLILLIVFVDLILIIFDFTGLPFLLELLFTCFLLFIAFISLIPAYSGSRGGWGFLSAVFLLLLFNLLFIYLRTTTGRVFLLTLLFTSIGFVISVLNIKRNEPEPHIPEPEEKEETVYTNFDPGKYVASKTGNSYHIPKCDWATKIKKNNQVWFDDEKEAKKKYKPHSCV